MPDGATPAPAAMHANRLRLDRTRDDEGSWAAHSTPEQPSGSASCLGPLRLLLQPESAPAEPPSERRCLAPSCSGRRCRCCCALRFGAMAAGAGNAPRCKQPGNIAAASVRTGNGKAEERVLYQGSLLLQFRKTTTTALRCDAMRRWRPCNALFFLSLHDMGAARLHKYFFFGAGGRKDIDILVIYSYNPLFKIKTSSRKYSLTP